MRQIRKSRHISPAFHLVQSQQRLSLVLITTTLDDDACAVNEQTLLLRARLEASSKHIRLRTMLVKAIATNDRIESCGRRCESSRRQYRSSVALRFIQQATKVRFPRDSTRSVEVGRGNASLKYRSSSSAVGRGNRVYKYLEGEPRALPAEFQSVSLGYKLGALRYSYERCFLTRLPAKLH